MITGYNGDLECCDGIELIGLIFEFPGGRTEISDIKGFCTKCGDGECKPPENKCSCPEDC